MKPLDLEQSGWSLESGRYINQTQKFISGGWLGGGKEFMAEIVSATHVQSKGEGDINQRRGKSR